MPGSMAMIEAGLTDEQRPRKCTENVNTMHTCCPAALPTKLCADRRRARCCSMECQKNGVDPWTPWRLLLCELVASAAQQHRRHALVTTLGSCTSTWQQLAMQSGRDSHRVACVTKRTLNTLMYAYQCCWLRI